MPFKEDPALNFCFENSIYSPKNAQQQNETSRNESNRSDEGPTLETPAPPFYFTVV